MLYRLRDMLLSQRAYLTAMTDYTAHGGKSRGSALHTDLTGWVKPFGQLLTPSPLPLTRPNPR